MRGIHDRKKFVFGSFIRFPWSDLTENCTVSLCSDADALPSFVQINPVSNNIIICENVFSEQLQHSHEAIYLYTYRRQ